MYEFSEDAIYLAGNGSLLLLKTTYLNTKMEYI